MRPWRMQHRRVIQHSRRGRIYAVLVHSKGVINDAPTNTHRVIQNPCRGRIHAALAYVCNAAA